MKRFTWLSIAVLIALWAEHFWHVPKPIPLDGFILFAMAIVIFLWQAKPLPSWPDGAIAARPWWHLGELLAGAGLLLGLSALFGFWQRANRYDGWPFWLWLIGIFIFLISGYFEGVLPGRRPFLERCKTWFRRHRWELLVLFLIIMVAFVVRVWHIASFPFGCQSDEGNNGLDALKWLHGAPYIPYAETNEGQATLFTYLIALFFQLFGVSVVSMRLLSAVVGTLTMAAFYPLARLRFKPPVALTITALFAVARWHITISRIVYELILVPLFLSLLVYFILKAQESGKRSHWLWGGLMLALGLNSYTAFRVVPAWIMLYFIYWLIRLGVQKSSRWRTDLQGMVLFTLSAALGSLPLLAYVSRHWHIFLSRTQHISVLGDVARAGSYQPVVDNARKVLLMFNFRGDLAALNNLPGAPMLGPIVGALALVGLFYALRYFWKPLGFLYTTWFLVGISTAIFTVVHEAPNARRVVMILPLAFLLAGEILQQGADAWQHAWGRTGRGWLYALLLLIALFGAKAGLHDYFVVQVHNPSVVLAFSPQESAIGQFIHGLPSTTTILVDPDYSHHSAVKLIGQKKVQSLDLTRDVPLRRPVQGDVVYILNTADRQVIPLLQQLYPDGAFREHRDPFGGTLFLSYRVPVAALHEAGGLTADFYAGDKASGRPLLHQKVAAVDFDFSQKAPLQGAFTLKLHGTLLVPKFGHYTFKLSTSGRTMLHLGQDVLIAANHGDQQVTKFLVAGFYPFTLSYYSGGTPGRLRLSWAGEGMPSATVGRGALYTLNIGDNGLVGYYYPNNNWQGMPAVVRRDLFIMPNNILREPFSIRWVGYIAAPKSGRYGFATRSDDGSMLWIDDKLVVDNGGSHGAMFKAGAIHLDAGFHKIRLDYFQNGGGRALTLSWTPPGAGQSVIPLTYLFPIVGDQIPETLHLPPPPLAVMPPASLSGQTPQPNTPPAGKPAASFPAKRQSLPALAVQKLWQTGHCGSGDGEFAKPRGVAVCRCGQIYVADSGNRRIVKLDADGKFITAWGSAGSGPDQFEEPFDVAVAPDGTVWVLDSVLQLLKHFTPDGKLIAIVRPESPWYRPRGLTTGPGGNLYVADTGGVRVVKMDQQGHTLAQIGGKKQLFGPGQPVDVAVIPSGLIFAAESASGRIWAFDAQGNVLRNWFVGQHNSVDAPHLAVLPPDRIAVTVPTTKSVQIYEADGTPYGQFGGANLFTLPLGIDSLRGNRIVVVDSATCRVQAFQLPKN